MNRRTFLTTIGAAAAASAAETPTTQFYAVDSYQLKAGTQPARVHDWLKNFIIPRLTKHGASPILALEAVIAPHTPEIVLITGVRTFADIWTINSKLDADPELKAAYEKFENGPEIPFETLSISVLQTAPYSPLFDAKKHDKPRYFEFRQYHSPTWSQLAALHDRMAGPESKIFHRVGIFPILYTSTLIGQNLPNLTYLIPFESLAAREKAWDAFAADPEWIKTRKESIDRHGQIASVNQISIYRATPYSPVS